MHRRHIPALTGLRFVLAIWVILFHLTGKRMLLYGWAQSAPAPVVAALRGGYLAVETFFVLSGFVLALSYGSMSWDSKSLIRYSAGRFARVYPAYLLGLLMIAPFIADYAGKDKPAQLAIYSFALQGWTPPAVYWNTPAWSLSCELFFYLSFPLIARLRLKAITLVSAAVLLPVLLARTGAPSTWKPVHHLADFLLGIAAAALYERLAKRRTNGLWFYVPAAALALMVISHADAISRTMDINAALRPLNAALIVGLALGGGLPAQLLSTRVATCLGNASYSMYILHVPLLWWYKRLTPAPSAAVYLTLVVLVSALAFRLVEQPAGGRIRSFLARERLASQSVST